MRSRKPARLRERQSGVTRLLILLVITFGAAACGSAASPASSQGSSPSPGITPSASASGESSPADAVAAFVADLEAAGATVSDSGAFDTDPLGGRGVVLCVAGQQVRVYEYEADAERAAVTARIDPTDPSNLGTTIIEWAGNPTFWQRDRIMVLYLGSDPAVEAAVTTVLGQPFARGQGRDPGPDRHAC